MYSGDAPLDPLNDRILVRALTATEEKSKGGVILPETSREKPQQGIVLALGDRVGKPSTSELSSETAARAAASKSRIEVGDRILYGKYSGSEITIDHEDYLVIREVDVLGILPPLPEEPGLGEQ